MLYNKNIPLEIKERAIRDYINNISVNCTRFSDLSNSDSLILGIYYNYEELNLSYISAINTIYNMIKSKENIRTKTKRGGYKDGKL